MEESARIALDLERARPREHVRGNGSGLRTHGRRGIPCKNDGPAIVEREGAPNVRPGRVRRAHRGEELVDDVLSDVRSPNEGEPRAPIGRRSSHAVDVQPRTLVVELTVRVEEAMG